jgi:hypothetical protein
MALEDYTPITDAAPAATLDQVIEKLNEVITILNTLVQEVKGENDATLEVNK